MKWLNSTATITTRHFKSFHAYLLFHFNDWKLDFFLQGSHFRGVFNSNWINLIVFWFHHIINRGYCCPHSEFQSNLTIFAMRFKQLKMMNWNNKSNWSPDEINQPNLHKTAAMWPSDKPTGLVDTCLASHCSSFSQWIAKESQKNRPKRRDEKPNGICSSSSWSSFKYLKINMKRGETENLSMFLHLHRFFIPRCWHKTGQV